MLRSENFLLLGALGLSLIAVGPVLQDPSLARMADDYLAIAAQWHQDASLPDTRAGPAYLVFLRLMFLDPDAAILVQVLMSALTCIGVARLSEGLGAPKRFALLAGWLWAVSPLRLALVGMIRTETMYLFLLFVVLWLVFCRAEVRAWLLSGLVLGVAALTRGNALILWCLAVGAVALFGRAALPRWIWLSMPFLVVVAGFSVRNQIEHGSFSFSSAAGYNIAVLIVGPARQHQEGVPVVAEADIWLEDGEVFASSFELGQTVRNRAVEWALANPGPVVSTNLTGLVRMLGGTARSAWERLVSPAFSTPIIAAGMLMRICLYLGFAGLLLARAASGAPSRLATALVLCVAAAHLCLAAGSGNPRFAFPVDPFALAWVAAALSGMFGRQA